MKQILVITATFLATLSLWAADKATITISNPLNTPRGNELVEIDVNLVKAKLDGISAFYITDADGKEVPSQITYDGKLIFSIGVPAKGKSIYYACKGQPSKYESKVFGPSDATGQHYNVTESVPGAMMFGTSVPQS